MALIWDGLGKKLGTKDIAGDKKKKPHTHKKNTTHWRDEDIQELISAFAFGAGGNPKSIRVNCPDRKVNLHLN